MTIHDKFEILFMFIFCICYSVTIGFMIKGKILFLNAGMLFTQLVVDTTYFVPTLLYIDVAILASIAVYSICFTQKPPILIVATILFLGRTPYIYQQFIFIGLNLHIISDLFNAGFLLCLVIYLLIFAKNSRQKLLILITFIIGFCNALIGISEGVLLTLNPINYDRMLRTILQTADLSTWAVFILLFFITVCILFFSTIFTKILKDENVLEEKDDEEINDTTNELIEKYYIANAAINDMEEEKREEKEEGTQGILIRPKEITF